ncbi:MAG: ATP-binding cassette domain-containing protein [bacterium]|nr:ATP-binding cassette domain-containing protein [bacterium]
MSASDRSREPDRRNGDAGIVARGLTRHFGEVRAVDGVDLEVAAGEVYGFLGPNGAGKTTITRMLCTLLRPTSGGATVAGYDIVREAGQVRLAIGVTLQEGALDDKLTGRELLRLQGRFYGLSRAEVERRIDEVSPILDVAAIDRRIGTYSGGMKRRLDVAASLIHNPRILFLDEPTTGLDPMSRAAVWEQVARLRSEFGMTIFLTTQYLEEADALADRVGIIDEGLLRAEGPPEELKRRIGADVIVVRLAEGVDGGGGDGSGGDGSAGDGSGDGSGGDGSGGDGGAVARAVAVLEGLPGASGVEAHGHEVTVATEDGAATISPVAVALSGADLPVMDIALRRPTLDDVFLDLTGRHIVVDEDPSGGGEDAAGRGES